MKLTATNIITILIITIAIIATIIFIYKKGIRPNSIIGKAIGKDGTCDLVSCKAKLNESNLYDKYCAFHKDYVNLSNRKNIDKKSMKAITHILTLDSKSMSNSDKKKYNKQILYSRKKS